MNNHFVLQLLQFTVSFYAKALVGHRYKSHMAVKTTNNAWVRELPVRWQELKFDSHIYTALISQQVVVAYSRAATCTGFHRRDS